MRSLRKLFLDFNRLIGILDKDILSKPDLVSELVSIYSIASFEFHSGKCKPENIASLCNSNFLRKLVSSTESKDEISTLCSKYVGHVRSSTLVGKKQWEEMFVDGYFDKEAINKSLRSTPYFYDERTPDWKKLSNLDDLEDDYFQVLYASVKNFLITGNIKARMSLHLF